MPDMSMPAESTPSHMGTTPDMEAVGVMVAPIRGAPMEALVGRATVVALPPEVGGVPVSALSRTSSARVSAASARASASAARRSARSRRSTRERMSIDPAQPVAAKIMHRIERNLFIRISLPESCRSRIFL